MSFDEDLNSGGLSFDGCFDPTAKRLDISDRGLREWPFAVDFPAAVRSLDASGNRFRRFPPGMLALTELREVRFLCNELVTLPDTIGLFRELEILDLEFNSIRFVSDRLGELSQLKRLNLCGGMLEALPASIGRLACIETLRIGYQLQSLPETVGQCRSLRELNVSGNRLTRLPETLSYLENLRDLRVDDNRLSSIPESLAQLQQLRWLHASGNPLIELPWFALELPNLRGLSCCDFLISRADVRRFGRACAERGILLFWNRPLSHCDLFDGADSPPAEP